jgi:hypothetical protein
MHHVPIVTSKRHAAVTVRDETATAERPAHPNSLLPLTHRTQAPPEGTPKRTPNNYLADSQSEPMPASTASGGSSS